MSNEENLDLIVPEFQDEESVRDWLASVPTEMRDQANAVLSARRILREFPIAICERFDSAKHLKSIERVDNWRILGGCAQVLANPKEPSLEFTEVYRGLESIPGMHSETPFSGERAWGFLENYLNFGEESTRNAYWDAKLISAGFIEFFSVPLWRDGPPELFDGLWRTIKADLDTLNGSGDWIFWIDLYEAIVSGRMLLSDLREHSDLLNSFFFLRGEGGAA